MLKYLMLYFYIVKNVKNNYNNPIFWVQSNAQERTKAFESLRILCKVQLSTFSQDVITISSK